MLMSDIPSIKLFLKEPYIAICNVYMKEKMNYKKSYYRILDFLITICHNDGRMETNTG